MIGLELLSPAIVAMLRHASPTKRRAASLAACRFAIEQARVSESHVSDAIERLRDEGTLTSDEKAVIDAITARLDEEYFDLHDAYEEGLANAQQYREVFAKARAVSSVSWVLEGHTVEGAANSIYEAAFAIEGDDKSCLFRLVESVLA
jgi:hypothetical protein